MEIIPPYEYLCLVSDYIPARLSTYLMLWREQDTDGRCIYTKDHIRDEKSLSWSKVINDIRRLTCKGLCEWKMLDDKETLVVILAQNQEDLGPIAC